MKKSIKQYEKLILAVLAKEVVNRPHSDLKDIVVADKEQHHYMLLRTGWYSPKEFVNHIVIHFYIAENGKIWLLENNTDVPITEELIKQGVPYSEIVLGFYPADYHHSFWYDGGQLGAARFYRPCRPCE